MIFKMDENDDIAVENGSWVLLEGQEEIEQNVKQNLRYLYGEFFLDTRKGIPWFQSILVKNPNPVIADTILKRSIILTPGIEELLSFSMDFESSLRKLTVSFKARTKYGILTIDDFSLA